MAKPDVWMPLYPGDYYRDTRRLTTEQHGAYFLLMLDYWTNGPPPDDDGELATIVGLSIESWRLHRGKLQGFFRVIEGRWRHKRIDKELAEATKNKATRSARGRLGADARWNAPSNASDDASSIALSNGKTHGKAIAKTCPSPSPSPSPSSTPSPSPIWACPPGVEAETWQAYLEVRKKKRAALTDRAYMLILRTLAAGDPEAMVAMSVMNGWTGIFNREERRSGRSAWLTVN